MSEPKRKKYTEEFKTEAVRLAQESGRPVAQVARELGIADNLLYRWRTEEHRARSLGTSRAVLKAKAEGEKAAADAAYQARVKEAEAEAHKIQKIATAEAGAASQRASSSASARAAARVAWTPPRASGVGAGLRIDTAWRDTGVLPRGGNKVARISRTTSLVCGAEKCCSSSSRVSASRQPAPTASG